MVARRKLDDVSYMSPGDFMFQLDQCFKDGGGQSAFAQISGLSRSQVNRYANGVTAIPQHIAMLVDLFVLAVKSGVPVPQREPVPLKKSGPIRLKKPRRRRLGGRSRATA